MRYKPVIGLVMKSLNAEFFQEMRKGAEEFAAEEQSFSLKCVGTTNQTEIDLQIELVRNFIDEKVDAIVLIPIDSKALVPVTVNALKSGIKVINIDIRLDEQLLAEAGVELTYVGPDNKLASKIVGDVLAAKLGSGANVILIEGLAVAENAQQRKAGFLASIEEFNLNLLATVACDWEKEKARDEFEILYRKFPEVEGVFCSNDAMAQGVIEVLRKNDKAGKVPVVGFDNDLSAQPLLANGQLLATIDAFGSQMAVQGIIYALKVLSGMKNNGSNATNFKLING